MMNKTELLNKITQHPEERVLLARVMDKTELARSRSVPAHTGFLSSAERASVETLLAAIGRPRHVFWGGYEGAERTICAFLPEWQDEDSFRLETETVALLHATFTADTALSHRDFLGSILALGITREKVGDLLVSAGACDILILRELTDFLLQHLERAGRVKLQLQPLPISALQPPEESTKRITDTVASLRLDAVMASGFSISRGKAAGFISAGRVQLNHRDCGKSDHAVAAGDVITCRGLGKCVLTETGGLSRKGRISIVLERYV
ncbi:MAG: YlmH/Sll1252 family protein [Oscillospiraceae bacterium]|nr:YlmH/Sll1252 family protein [Oscillospiraceae bacterium]